jgi:hypothetical protein
MIDELKKTLDDYTTNLDVFNSLKCAYLSVTYLTMLSLAKPT